MDVQTQVLQVLDEVLSLGGRAMSFTPATHHDGVALTREVRVWRILRLQAALFVTKIRQRKRASRLSGTPEFSDELRIRITCDGEPSACLGRQGR